MHDFDRIAAVIRYIEKRHTSQPDLATLAQQAGLSPWHLQRLFSRWAGISPKAFLQSLTQTHARQCLKQGESVLDAALHTGLSGPGRLHDLCVKLEAASPGEVKSGGQGWTIEAGFAESPFGLCLIGESPRGICYFSFVESRARRTAKNAILEIWPRSNVQWNDRAAAALADRIFVPSPQQHGQLRAFVRGSRFQIRVWRALLCIPPGALVSYGRLAAALGSPRAARAVGSAVGKNPLACLIPCHRVIHESGIIGEYRWGSTRKKALIVRESANSPPSPPGKEEDRIPSEPVRETSEKTSTG